MHSSTKKAAEPKRLTKNGKVYGDLLSAEEKKKLVLQKKKDKKAKKVRKSAQQTIPYDKLLDKLRGSEGEKNIRDQQNALITSLNLRLNGVSKKRTRLYEDYAEGLLDEAEYSFAKKSYDEQYADLSRRLDEAVQRRSKFDEAMSVDNKWITLMKSVSTATQLSQDLVDEYVELVKVHEGGAVELVMKYGDIYELTIQSINEVQEAM